MLPNNIRKCTCDHEALNQSAQSDQSLRCPHEQTLQPWLSQMRPVKILIRLCECTVWSKSSLGVQVRMYVSWRYDALFFQIKLFSFPQVILGNPLQPAQELKRNRSVFPSSLGYVQRARCRQNSFRRWHVSENCTIVQRSTRYHLLKTCQNILVPSRHRL